MPRHTAGVLAIVLVATACSVEPIEDPGIGAGDLTTTVYAADGSVLTEWHAEQDRVLVTYDELPKHLVDAVVAIEDRRFWIHPGVDVRAVARAAVENIEAGDVVQGGSTITQQYVKNVLLTDAVTLERKAEEIGLALQLEETLTKTEIFERYANTIFLGEGAYGLGAAAKRYFGKSISALTLGESALLAGMIAAPTEFNPYDHLEAALQRREVVLDTMIELGWIDTSSAIRAAGEPVTLASRGAADRMRFPYFTDEVRRSLLENPALGDTPEDRWRMVTGGGLRIFTTVRPDVQMAAEIAIASVLSPDGPSAALVAVDPRNGDVLAIVGGRDFYAEDDPVAQFNLATQGLRQPGSAFKPFALAAALEAGVELDSTWPGGRSATVQTDVGPWLVTNYEEAFYPGLTLQEATVFSVNLPYAYLVDWIGADRVVATARAAGITSDLAATPSVVLGAQEVTVLEMASAYATFAAGGIHVDPVLVTRVESADGTVLYEHVPIFSRVLDATVADQVTATLTEAVRRGTGQQAKIGRPVAGKTGTTEANHDAWFVGYTPEISAAVWVGFPEGNRALESPNTPYTITGGTWPAQIWSRFAIAALSGIAYTPPTDGDTGELVTVSIDLSTGFIAGPLCPRATVAVVRLDAGRVPSIVCPIHNPEGVLVSADGTVPAVESLAMIDAVSMLEMAGYTIRLAWAVETAYVPGTIIGQFPAGGTPLEAGAVVEIVASGPAPGTAPSVLGRHRSDAITRLDAAGLSVDVILVADPGAAIDPESLTVWAQLPAAGEPVDGRVTIWVSP
ncbi:MAG TPA: PBP1A family penicillin-binding protein [Acidimicrobiia bacterium]|nr:PBP1A family penicillin-binding protein [Acidimicrobiia bacterium]